MLERFALRLLSGDEAIRTRDVARLALEGLAGYELRETPGQRSHQLGRKGSEGPRGRGEGLAGGGQPAAAGRCAMCGSWSRGARRRGGAAASWLRAREATNKSRGGGASAQSRLHGCAPWRCALRG